jgi:hypothetical protein
MTGGLPVATAVTATGTYGVWLHAAQLSAGRPAGLQRDEGEEGGAAITEASEASPSTPSPRHHTCTLTDDTHV